ncbi:helix-turn-helix domain-containing protein [Kitasatospora sp. NPDC058965]|uniref:helix-turn-helix domain-containing protein n=1 Tax=Kitasatospora sp. NPDC058965 TaxID=3346682 RepID=UPI003694B4F1
MTVHHVFGHELRRLRTQQGVSLKALSEMTHYSKGYLSRVETGARAATPELAQRCDDVLGAGGALRARVATTRLVAEPRVNDLRLGTGPFGRPAKDPTRPAQLPMAEPDFVGRAEALRQLDALPAPHRVTVCAISGMAGTGKTALAVHWAHRARNRFPDGCLFAELSGPDGNPVPPVQVLGAFLGALLPGTPLPATLAERSALFRTLLDGRRMLVVLDGAVGAEQVRPLLPAAPGCLVLVTSRQRLTGLTAAHPLPLPPLTPGEATELAATVIGPTRTGLEPGAVRELVESCGLLPLAVRLAATQLAARPSWLVSSLTERLRQDDELLLRLGGGALAYAFRSGYQRLSRSAADAFRRIAPLDGPLLAVSAAAVVLGRSRVEAEAVLEELVDASLLDTPAPGLYRCHPLLGAFARTLAQRLECGLLGAESSYELAAPAVPVAL